MSGDRPIAPSPARLRLAHAAGARPDARWLTAGLVCVSLGALLGGIDGAVDPATLGHSLRIGRIELGETITAVRFAARLAAVGVGAIVGAALLSRILVGGLGPIQRSAARRLGRVRVRPPVPLLALVVVAVLGAGIASVAGVVAGAARTVAAPGGMLGEIWGTWATRGLLVVGGLLCAVGLLEVIAWRSAARRALHVSIERARRDAREHQRKSPP